MDYIVKYKNSKISYINISSICGGGIKNNKIFIIIDYYNKKKEKQGIYYYFYEYILGNTLHNKNVKFDNATKHMVELLHEQMAINFPKHFERQTEHFVRVM
jgi:hypothetical protein